MFNTTAKRILSLALSTVLITSLFPFCMADADVEGTLRADEYAASESAASNPAPQAPAPKAEAPAQETQTAGAPAPEIPGTDSPAQKRPGELIPSEGSPIEDCPGEPIPTDELPMDDFFPEETPGEPIPTDELPTDDFFPEETPDEDIPTEDFPIDEEAGELIPGDETFLETDLTEELPDGEPADESSDEDEPRDNEDEPGNGEDEDILIEETDNDGTGLPLDAEMFKPKKTDPEQDFIDSKNPFSKKNVTKLLDAASGLIPFGKVIFHYIKEKSGDPSDPSQVVEDMGFAILGSLMETLAPGSSSLISVVKDIAKKLTSPENPLIKPGPKPIPPE